MTQDWGRLNYTRQLSTSETREMLANFRLGWWFPREPWFADEEAMLKAECSRCDWSVRTESDIRGILQTHWFNCEACQEYMAHKTGGRG